MIRGWIAALCIVGLGSPAAAQEPVDPAAMAAARDLLAAVDIERQAGETAARMTEAVVDSMMRRFRESQGEDFPAELETELRRIVMEHNAGVVGRMMPTMRDDAARVYARHFSADELRELARLQSHPVMRKAQALGPQLFTELSRIGMNEAAAAMPELQRRVQAAIESWIARNAPPTAG